MKIKATQDAWYKKKKIREGQIVDYNEPEVPCWGTLADGDVFVEEKGVNEVSSLDFPTTPPVVKDDEPVEPDSDADESDGEDSDEDDEQDEDESEDDGDEENEPDEQGLEKDLELIRDLAVENDVWVEIPDNCTAKEEIELIKQGLSAKGIKLNF